MPARSYTSKPTQIEAIRWDGHNIDELTDWIGDHVQHPRGGKLRLFVRANSAWVELEVGEWIAKDRIGFYPIKDEIFLEKYVPTALNVIGANLSAAEATYPQSQR